jgi:peptidoglycan/xylan/chitin deacetylase (PgdA/CDA1 family)/CelD/BcsL family acetyltransferase involved in cellulose biosynthesis
MIAGRATDYTTAVLTSPAALDGLGAEWAELFAQQAAPGPALHPEWVRTWWDVYGAAYSDPARGLRVLTVRRAGRLVGVLPLYARAGGLPGLGPRRLGFVSIGEREHEETCPEYLDLLHPPGEAAPCLEAVASVLSGPGFSWDEIRLPDVPAASPLCSLGDVLAPPITVAVTPRGDCPIADLRDGFEAYLRRLSSASRQQFRRLLKAASAAKLELEVAVTAADVEAYFEQLVALHQARWTTAGKPGCFAAPRFTAFHRALAGRWVPAGRAVLARLVQSGTPLALVYGFVAGTKFHFYQSGVRAEAPVRYPGFVAHLWLMERLARQGVAAYDFLRGAGAYKDRFATDCCPLVQVEVRRPGLRNYCQSFLATGWRRSRKRMKASEGPRVSKQEWAARLIEASRVGPLGRRLRAWSGVLALNWHRIGHGAGSTFDRGLWSATPEGFADQVAVLKRHFDVIGPDDLPDVLGQGAGRYVLLTFDDGYRDNYTHAFPVLKAHGVRAAFFVATGFLDRPRPPWWDEIAWMVRLSPRRSLPAGPRFATPVVFDEPHREQAIDFLLRCYKALPGTKTAGFLDYLAEATGAGRCPAGLFADAWLTWDMVRELRAAGMTVGGHTVNHPLLARLTRAEQEAEVAECGRRLHEELGEPMDYFSYPVGSRDAFNFDSRRALLEQGVRFAFSFYGGYCRFDAWDPLNLPRTAVEAYFSPALFRSMVTFPHIFG